MASEARPAKPMTVEEYLAFEEASPVKHEYVDGELFAFAGARERHVSIVTNLVYQLRGAARRTPCRVFASDMKLRATRTRYYYPDVFVVCDPSDDDELVKTRPCLVAEVLSPSTAPTDRREKLLTYRQIESLQTYLVVSQTAARVEHHWRDTSGHWWHATRNAADVIPIPCLDFHHAVGAIYEDIILPAAPADDVEI